ncbi:MAG: nucleoside-diphosphate kinase [Planctomycetota bacterium]|nr:nucleoside-diphosphate kinase [Planctomycetota bacterium]
MERTLVLVKPDGVQRGLIGRILSRFEDKGLKLVGLKTLTISPELAERHYAPHKGKPFYEGLVRYMTSAPVVAAVVEGPRAVDLTRSLMGATFGWQAEPGTIRGDFGLSSGFNLIHGSDSVESAAHEIELFFRPEELCAYERDLDRWIISSDDG